MPTIKSSLYETLGLFLMNSCYKRLKIQEQRKSYVVVNEEGAVLKYPENFADSLEKSSEKD